jgi:hypothetical protein
LICSQLHPALAIVLVASTNSGSRSAANNFYFSGILKLNNFELHQ